MEKSSSLNGVDYLDKLRESNAPEGLGESSTRPQARSRRRASCGGGAPQHWKESRPA